VQHFTIEVAGTAVALVSAIDLAMAEEFVWGNSPDAKVFRDELIARRHGLDAVAIRLATRDEIDMLEDRFSDPTAAQRAARADQEYYVAWLPPPGFGGGDRSSQ
jgi:hypothetical protein